MAETNGVNDILRELLLKRKPEEEILSNQRVYVNNFSNSTEANKKSKMEGLHLSNLISQLHEPLSKSPVNIFSNAVGSQSQLKGINFQSTLNKNLKTSNATSDTTMPYTQDLQTKNQYLSTMHKRNEQQFTPKKGGQPGGLGTRNIYLHSSKKIKLSNDNRRTDYSCASEKYQQNQRQSISSLKYSTNNDENSPFLTYSKEDLIQSRLEVTPNITFAPNASTFNHSNASLSCHLNTNHSISKFASSSKRSNEDCAFEILNSDKDEVEVSVYWSGIKDENEISEPVETVYNLVKKSKSIGRITQDASIITPFKKGEAFNQNASSNISTLTVNKSNNSHPSFFSTDNTDNRISCLSASRTETIIISDDEEENIFWSGKEENHICEPTADYNNGDKNNEASETIIEENQIVSAIINERVEKVSANTSNTLNTPSAVLAPKNNKNNSSIVISTALNNTTMLNETIVISDEEIEEDFYWNGLKDEGDSIMQVVNNIDNEMVSIQNSNSLKTSNEGDAICIDSDTSDTETKISSVNIEKTISSSSETQSSQPFALTKEEKVNLNDLSFIQEESHLYEPLVKCESNENIFTFDENGCPIPSTIDNECSDDDDSSQHSSDSLDNNIIFKQMQEEIESNNQLIWRPLQSAFNKSIKSGVICNKTHSDPVHFLDDCSKVLEQKMKKCFVKELAYKINATLCCDFKIIKNNEELYDVNYFETNSSRIYKYDVFKNWFTDNIQKPIIAKLEGFEERESGWTLTAVINLTINIFTLRLLLGGCYIRLPTSIASRKACINVQNKDNACFAWAVVASMFYENKPIKKRWYRITTYPHYGEVLKLDGIGFPMKVAQVPLFEKLNDMSINVYGLKQKKVAEDQLIYFIEPVYVSRNVKEKHINLLLFHNKYSDENDKAIQNQRKETLKYHYVWIKSMSRLLSAQFSKHNSSATVCNICLRHFKQIRKFEEHVKNCSIDNYYSYVDLPTPTQKYIAYKNYMRKKKLPFVIYADYKCYDSKIYEKPIVFSIGYYVKCSYDPTLSFYKFFRGENCLEWFANELKDFVENVETVFICEVPKNKMTKQEEKAFKDPNIVCHVCEKPFTKNCKKVKNNCHFTGEYWGPSHEVCNMNYRDHRTIPVFLHNRNEADSKLLIENLENDFFSRTEFHTTLKNKKDFLSFTKFTDCVIKFRFMDSKDFMNENLNDLIPNLSSFLVIKPELSNLDENKFKLLTNNPPHLGKYFRNESQFQEKSLPSFSKLKDINESDFDLANKIWKEFELQNLGEYSDLCLKINILLLAEVFEEFRDVCIEKYDLDPCYCCNLQDYSWDAMLRYTSIKLELLTDYDMITFFESGTRGSINLCPKKYVKANNIYLEKYNEEEEEKYIMQFDINNQYDYAMSQYLPTHDFQWVNDVTCFDVESVSDESAVGYVLEVDLEYPDELHDLHKDFPFCPEYQNPLDFNTRKNLNATLQNKVKYVLHYRHLKQILKHGLKITKIHRILQFKQSAWLKPYIDFNRELSKSSITNFERNFYEKMNYVIFEKCSENYRQESRMACVFHSDKRFGSENLISRQEFKTATILNNKFIVIEKYIIKLTLKKPIYLGMCMKEFCKIKMYNFHYDYMKEKLNRNCSICYIDNNTIIYEIKCQNIYKVIAEECFEHFDTSDYNEENIWNIPQVNKKGIGLIKDRFNGKVISEFVALRPKMYAIKLDEREKPMHMKRVKEMESETVISPIQFSNYNIRFEESGELLVSLKARDVS